VQRPYAQKSLRCVEHARGNDKKLGKRKIRRRGKKLSKAPVDCNVPGRSWNDKRVAKTQVRYEGGCGRGVSSEDQRVTGIAKAGGRYSISQETGANWATVGKWSARLRLKTGSLFSNETYTSLSRKVRVVSEGLAEEGQLGASGQDHE